MSNYLKVQTEMRDQTAFVTALTTVCQANRIPVETGQDLVAHGFAGRSVGNVNAVIRKQALRSYGDLGFRYTDGGIEVILDDSDTRGQALLRQIKVEYAKTRVTTLAERRGMQVVEVPTDDGTTRLRLIPQAQSADRRRVYVR